MTTRNTTYTRLGVGGQSIVKLTASATLGGGETTVRTDTTAAAITVTLPDVKDAEGQTYSIIMETAGNNTTVADAAATTIATLTTVEESVLVRSDGLVWTKVVGNQDFTTSQAFTASGTALVNSSTITVDSTAGAVAVTMPPEASCAGKIYQFEFTVDGGDLTVLNDAAALQATLIGVDGYLTLYCDGKTWIQLLFDTGT